MAADDQNVTLLGLLDMSAAFDTVDHVRMETSFGVSGNVLNFFLSERVYTADPFQRIGFIS